MAAGQQGRQSVGDLESRAVLWPRTAPVVEACCGNIGVAEPLLHLGDVGAGGGRGAERVGAEARHRNAHHLRVVLDDALINSPVGKVPRFGVGLHGPKERPLQILAVPRRLQVSMDAFEGRDVGRDVAQLTPLPLHAEMRHSLAQLQILDPQLGKLLAAQPVVEEGGEDGAIPLALQGVGRGSIEERPSVPVADGRGLPLVGFGAWALDPSHGVVGDGVALAKVVEEGADSRELAADRGRGERTGLQVFAPGDHVGAGDPPHFLGGRDPHKAAELAHVALVGAAGARVVDIGEPLHLGRHPGQALELGAGKQPPLAGRLKIEGRNDLQVGGKIGRHDGAEFTADNLFYR